MTMNSSRPSCRQRTRRRRWLFIGSSWFALLLAIGCVAVVVGGSNQAATGTLSVASGLPAGVGIDQRLNAQVPLDICLRDESGNVVRLQQLMDGKPIILTPVYFQCPMLCNMTLDGQMRSLNELSLDAGRDFKVLNVSFDPREGHTLAASAKRTALERYRRGDAGQRDAERGWRFLTGDEAELRRLMQSIGFRYRFDPATGQYAHAAGLLVLTPEGIVSRYLYGVEFSPRDLRLALSEASAGQVGSVSDQFLLLCYHYDPTTGKYGLAIMNVLRLGGLATMLGLGTAILVMIRQDRRRMDLPTEQEV